MEGLGVTVARPPGWTCRANFLGLRPGWRQPGTGGKRILVAEGVCLFDDSRGNPLRKRDLVTYVTT